MRSTSQGVSQLQFSSSKMEAKCCCFCKRSWTDRRNYQRLFGTASESLRRTIIANGMNLLSAMLHLQEAFEEGSVVCKGCRQFFVNFEKKSQEVEALGECVRPLLLEALTRTGSATEPLSKPCSPGHTRPPPIGKTSTPKRLRFQPEGGHESVGQSPSVQVCVCA